MTTKETKAGEREWMEVVEVQRECLRVADLLLAAYDRRLWFLRGKLAGLDLAQSLTH